MTRGLRALAAAALLMAGASGPVTGATPAQMLSFQDLAGWEADNHAAALQAFVETCDSFNDERWQPICQVARTGPEAKPFFELFFRPVLIGGTEPALFTGYFEPELDGARQRGGRYQYPLYRKPPGLQPGTQWATRQQIEEGGLLAGRGLELAWVDDPVEAFFLQIQGSGRIRLADGGLMRVGYGGANGYAYRSIGEELVRRGIFNRHQVSAATIRNWVRANPAAGRELLWHNPSYVFFREVSQVPASKGPLGAMARSITPLRSVAIDPAFVPLGAPVWIEKGGRGPMRRLMVAQDTGGAIKGAQRADIFFGTGDAAGLAAGTVRDAGRLIVLLPIDEAFRLAPGG